MKDEIAPRSIIPVTIWMNMPSFYQIELYQQLATMDDLDLQVIFARDLHPDRKSLGWQSLNDEVGFPFRILSSSRKGIEQALTIAMKQRKRIHVINGIWAEPSLTAVLVMLKWLNAPYLIYSEGPDPFRNQSSWRSVAKRGFAHWVASSGGVLAVSRFAREYYKALGFAIEHVYDYAYFETKPTLQPMQPRKNEIDVVFVGQFIRRKGVDLLIEAFASLYVDNPRLRLTLIGSGNEQSNLEAQSRRLSCENAVSFEGIMSSSQVRERLVQAHLLVLPSRFDGWGIVANEALSVGVPVIISNMCGASELINHRINGYIFESDNSESLRECLADYLADPLRWEALRLSALQTGEQISTSVAAIYLVRCIRHFLGLASEKPSAPWLISSPTT